MILEGKQDVGPLLRLPPRAAHVLGAELSLRVKTWGAEQAVREFAQAGLARDVALAGLRLVHLGLGLVASADRPRALRDGWWVVVEGWWALLSVRDQAGTVGRQASQILDETRAVLETAWGRRNR